MQQAGALVLLGLLVLLAANAAEAAKHKFKEGDKITLWANKGGSCPAATLATLGLPSCGSHRHLSYGHAAAVGPFSSPTETYQYYDLPFCAPTEKDNKLLSLGEVSPEMALPSKIFALSFFLCCRHPALLIFVSLVQVVDGNRMVATEYNLSFKTNKDRTELCNKKLTAAEVEKFRKAIKSDYYFQFVYDDLPIWGYIGKLEASKGECNLKRAVTTFSSVLETPPPAAAELPGPSPYLCLHCLP
jgi:hypothetical protein